MAAFPLPTGASDQAIAAPKTMYMKAGSTAMKNIEMKSRPTRCSSIPV